MNIIKIIIIVIFVIIASLTPLYVLASYKKVPLVLDMPNAPKLPKRFRSTLNVPQKNDIDWHGLKELNMAGSGQFSKLALEKILKQLHPSKLVVIDLRQESHGFLNGNAVCWYGHRAALNAGKTDQEIEADQAARLNDIGDSGSVFVNKNPGFFRSKQPKIEYALHSKSSEETLVGSYPLEYRRVYVQNYHAPDETQVDRFISIVKTLPKNSWVYFHCRAGLGRTTTFMAMYDMMHNAKDVSFQDIIKRQAALGGKNLSHLPSKHSFKYKFAEERLAFLHTFYDYAKQNNDAFATPFSTWLQKAGQ